MRALLRNVLGASLAFVTAMPAHAQMTLPDGEAVVFHHRDALGTVLAQSDHKGQVLHRSNTTPYGEGTGRRALDGQGYPDNAFASTRAGEGYTGHVDDRTLGLTYMRARYYDPALGRFLSNDPVGFVELNTTTFNRYAYGNNNPYHYIDPDGRDARDVLLIQKDIARLFPEIVSGIEVEYKDLGGDSGLASRWRKKLFLPSEAETDQLDQDGFDALYGTVLHESMHVTDSFLSGWGKSIVDVWSKVWSGTLFDEKTVGPKHQEIYNREYYELIGTETGSPTVPVWSNGEAPKSPVGVDTETLYEGTREND